MTVRNYFRLLTVRKSSWPTCVLILNKCHSNKVVTSPPTRTSTSWMIDLICEFYTFHRMPNIFSIVLFICHRQSFFTTVEQRGWESQIDSRSWLLLRLKRRQNVCWLYFHLFSTPLLFTATYKSTHTSHTLKNSSWFFSLYTNFTQLNTQKYGRLSCSLAASAVYELRWKIQTLPYGRYGYLAFCLNFFKSIF